MAHILNLENVSVALGSRPILGDVSLSLEDGSRIGIVGPNGGGKSTLFKLMIRELSPDDGRVTMVNGTRFAFLTQADSLDPALTVRQAIHSGTSEFEWASDAHIREIHRGLIPDVDLDRSVTALSGGQRRRVALAAALCQEAEVVILDEPTNHLDIEGVTFLADYLNRRFSRGTGALVVVTHDRWFLDAVCERLWEVVPGDDGAGGRNPRPGHVEVYEGGYAAYILQRAERARIAQQAAQKRNNLLRKELAWLRRGAPARTSKPRFRIEAANELIADEPPPRDSVELAKMATTRLGKEVVDLIDVDFAWENAEPGEQGNVLSNVTLRLAPGERIGILGRNGAGKSSLLGLINKSLRPTAGRVKHGKTVVLATLSQETRELDAVADRRVVEAVHEIATHVTVGKKEMSASQLVERLGFTRERAWTPVSELSGGERRRLQLLRLMVGEPNVLLLDEPTNDLDTDTLAAVEDLLDSWPGTLVVVSHDRYLLERVTDHQVAVIDGTVRGLPGGVEQYLELSAQAGERASGAGAGSAGGGSSGGSSGGSGTVAAGAGASVGSHAGAGADGVSAAARERQAKKTMDRLERQIAKLQQQIDALGVQQTEFAMSGDYEQLARVGKEIAALQEQVEQREEEWLEASVDVTS
ncbi:ABC-F family ATP-binding cassette domain-containing protein [Arcanobacterium bovis]|uniref:ABC transporter ATP-binding protein n=1 Tax=Arcanobacterium bovis TaxID=2529275 RepID=A0A4Q9V295_9ACTO|nr:ABC-F family ATP-binding cassette domain-containing protein [Arcanobacterium bovis]TBW23730.1 ABC transporter ATP-binding protein [Arcanobacterium bovis]